MYSNLRFGSRLCGNHFLQITNGIMWIALNTNFCTQSIVCYYLLFYKRVLYFLLSTTLTSINAIGCKRATSMIQDCLDKISEFYNLTIDHTLTTKASNTPTFTLAFALLGATVAGITLLRLLRLFFDVTIRKGISVSEYIIL